jgi:peptidyl-tRNA hydrolase, PTH1 family
MWLIVGLGNPGKKYDGTRHNIGFEVAEKIGSRAGITLASKFSGRFGRGNLFGVDVAVLMPDTFMNLSGDSVQPACGFLKLAPTDVIVIHDELDLPFGDVRIKVGGGHAGHNGLRSILGRMTPEFARIRMGIGRPPPAWEVADFVLARFNATEAPGVGAMIDRGCELVEASVKLGPAKAMNQLHGAAKEGKKGQEKPKSPIEATGSKARPEPGAAATAESMAEGKKA